jgi:hypothetical protein
MAQPATPIRRETGEQGRSHSANFDHRRRPEALRTAMATRKSLISSSNCGAIATLSQF